MESTRETISLSNSNITVLRLPWGEVLEQKRDLKASAWVFSGRMKGIPFVFKLFDLSKTLFTLLCILFGKFAIELIFLLFSSRWTEAQATPPRDFYGGGNIFIEQTNLSLLLKNIFIVLKQNILQTFKIIRFSYLSDLTTSRWSIKNILEKV